MTFHDEELIEVGGYRLTLAIDFRIIDLAEHLTGKRMPEMISALAVNRPPVGISGQLLWVMLRRHHEQMTLDQSAGLVLGEHGGTILAAVFELLQRAMSFGEAKHDGEKSDWSIESFLIQWVSLGGSPSEFWKQTPRSFIAIMEGMAKAANRQVDLAILGAWHTAIFGLNGFDGKLKGKKLSDFLSAPEKKEVNTKSAQAIAFFNSLKARGIEVEITRH